MSSILSKYIMLAAASGLLDTNPFPKKNRNVSHNTVSKETQEQLIAKAEEKRKRKAEKLKNSLSK